MNLIETRRRYANGEITKPEYISEAYESHKALFDYADILAETDIREIRILDGEMLAYSRQDGLCILVNRGEERGATFEFINFGGLVRSEMDLLASVVHDSKSMIDIGANIGWVSLTLAKRVPDLQIKAFEPIPSTFEILKRNLALNNSIRIEPINMGLSDHEGQAELYFYEAASGNTSLANVSGRSDVTSVKCELTTVDKYVEKTGFPVDFIKIDVEGAELFAIEGALNTLRAKRPILFVELLRKWAAAFDYHPNDVISLLAELGYVCYAIGSNAPAHIETVTEETIETNYLFLHPENHADKIAIVEG